MRPKMGDTVDSKIECKYCKGKNIKVVYIRGSSSIHYYICNNEPPCKGRVF